MRKRRFVAVLAFLLAVTLLLCSCADKESSVKLPNEQTIRQKISEIITDRIDDPVKLSESEKENVWEVSLPDRNGIKVQFRFYKYNSGVRIADMRIFDLWVLYSETNYVTQIVSSFDNNLKADINKKYGITEESTEYDHDAPCVTVHTDMTFEELTNEKAVAYINECMKLYDFKAVQVSESETRHNGVGDLRFRIVMDNVIYPVGTKSTFQSYDGTPLTYEIDLIRGGLSFVKQNDEGEYFDETWVCWQMDKQRETYIRRVEN